MYELIIKILDKSRDEGVDVLVSADMVIAEEGHTDEILAAKKIVSKFYDVFAKCRRENREDLIKDFCAAIDIGDSLKIVEIKDMVKKL